MAEFKIDGRMTVRTLKDGFKNEFEGTLRVYNGREFADDNATLASIRKGDANGSELVCHASDTVGKFEEEMKEVFGIKIQVASPDDYVLALDGITLANIKNIKKYATKADMEELVAYKRQATTPDAPKGKKYTIEISLWAKGVQLLEVTEDEKDELSEGNLNDVFYDWASKYDYDFYYERQFFYPFTEYFELVVKDEDDNVVYETPYVSALSDKTDEDKSREFKGVKDGFYLARVQTLKGMLFCGELELNEPFDADKLYLVQDSKLDIEFVGDKLYPACSIYYQQGEGYDSSRDVVWLCDKGDMRETDCRTILFEVVNGNEWCIEHETCSYGDDDEDFDDFDDCDCDEDEDEDEEAEQYAAELPVMESGVEKRTFIGWFMDWNVNMGEVWVDYNYEDLPWEVWVDDYNAGNLPEDIEDLGEYYDYTTTHKAFGKNNPKETKKVLARFYDMVESRYWSDIEDPIEALKSMYLTEEEFFDFLNRYNAVRTDAGIDYSSVKLGEFDGRLFQMAATSIMLLKHCHYIGRAHICIDDCWDFIADVDIDE